MSGAVGAQPVPEIVSSGREACPKEMLIDVAQLEREYFERKPDLSDPNQMVSFGTSGHRGSPLHGTFTEAHILAITQAICDYRRAQGPTARSTWARTRTRCPIPAQRTALEVLAANGVETIIQRDNGVTPTPVISRAILVYNRGRKEHLADGIVITPSHNPPEDGGFKYNPTNGGPADTDVTGWVQDRANELLRGNNAGVKRVPYVRGAIKARSTTSGRLRLPYVKRPAKRRRHGCDSRRGPQAGRRPARRRGQHYWEPINAIYGLDITS
jgi:phosphoglucomutase